MTRTQRKMQTLKNKINDLGSGPFANLVECAWLAAMDNAYDTFGFADVDNDEYWSLAYRSISSTSIFNDNGDVAKWFNRNGYKY